MEQPHKKYKGSQKHFSLWMLSETEDFYPTQIPNDPLKKISEYMKARSVDLPEPTKEVYQKETKKKPIVVHYKADFNVIRNWEKFPKDLNLELARFLGPYETITLSCTCKYLKKAFEDEAIWSWFLRKDLRFKLFENPRKEEREFRSIKLYYKYLDIKERAGIPYHTGYFQTFGTPEVMGLVDGMVDFMVPTKENIKSSVSEIMSRNKSKMMEIRLSWIKETGEICLWNADFSITVEEKVSEDKKMNVTKRTINKFYPCFIKKYLVEEGKIEETYFLEDQFLVIKFLNNLKQVVFRVIDVADELYSIGKNWSKPAATFDYIIIEKADSGAVYEKKEDDKSVSFMIKKQGEMKLKLLKDDQAVFYTQGEKKAVIVYWDLKENKELGLVERDLEAPICDILCSKREKNEVLRSFILGEHMNVYCVEVLGGSKEVRIKEILLPKAPKEEKSEEENDVEEEEEEGNEEVKEDLETKYLNESKANRKRKYQNLYFSTFQKGNEIQQKHNRFEDKVRKYYHDIFTTDNGQEEWLIVQHQESFHFVNLDKEELRNFDVEEGTGRLQQRNWNVYRDKLIILSPTHVFCHQISFEKQKLSPAFYRDILIKDPPMSVMPWIFQDECFTIIVLAPPSFNTNTSKLSLIVTSTQEFFHNNSNMLNRVYHVFLTNDVLGRPDRWEVEKEDFTEKIQMKFQDEKFFVLGERSSFYFDLSAVSKQAKALPAGWNSNTFEMSFNNNSNIPEIAPQAHVKTEGLATAKEVVDEDKNKKPKGSKLVNYMKLEENRNGAGVKEKGNGWSKNGKSDLVREQDKEKKVVKGKGDKYYKNIRQGRRSEKIN